ncbi:hypothetical protein BH23CHL2_BH23CHL2_26110 [soil metagenome]
MQVVDFRALDGPNWFRLEPVIKIGLALDPTEDRDSIFESVSERIRLAHNVVKEDAPWVTLHETDPPDECVVAFDWKWRSFAVGAARFALDESLAVEDTDAYEELRQRLEEDRHSDDTPEWVRDSERTVRAAGVTGTNGKTTTTRLLAHIAQQAGRSVGWSSSTGVYINGEAVLEGDYSGPSGARRVLLDPEVEIGILETARGGLLLRGLAYESNDVGIFLNISADHLSLHGVERIETLAVVKSVVVRVTRPDGLVVLNADDPIVLNYAEAVRAPVMLISQHPDADPVRQHIERGLPVVVRESDNIVLYRDRERTAITNLSDVPVTFGGAAPFMVENALAATGGAIGLGFDLSQIVSGLATFRNDSHSNKGRLNIFDVDGKIVIVDYAHNDIGLAGLAKFSRNVSTPDAKLHLVVGTAGDRRDEDFLALGRLAGDLSDVVYLKDTPGYLRGRARGDMPELMRQGFSASNGPAVLAGDFGDEMTAFLAALDNSAPGDVIAVMSQSDQDRLIGDIRNRGGQEWGETG